MTPDRHLGSAWVDECRPDLLITESTYATTIRDSKRCRERDFLQKVWLLWRLLWCHVYLHVHQECEAVCELTVCSGHIHVQHE